MYVRRLQQRVGHYPEVILQYAGRRRALGNQPNMMTVRSVRVELHVLLCHLFFGPNKLKMWRALEAEAGLSNSSSTTADGGQLFEGVEGEDPTEASSSRQAQARREFEQTVECRIGITTIPTQRLMVCHRDLPYGVESEEYKLQPDVELVEHGGGLPLRPRCLCYNCINVLHLFPSTASCNGKTGRKQQQIIGRKRRQGMLSLPTSVTDLV